MKYVISLFSICFSLVGHCAETPSHLINPGALKGEVVWGEEKPINNPSSVGYALIEPAETRDDSGDIIVNAPALPLMPRTVPFDVEEIDGNSAFDSPFTDSPGGVIRRKRLVRSASLSSVRAYNAADFDPFKSLVKWRFGPDVTVGQALKKVSHFLGYTLIIRDERVGNVYSMLLPYSHRNVRNINAQTALEMLGGQGMIVVVDHSNRTLMHRIKRAYDLDYDVSSLPICADQVAFATMPSGAMGDRVLIVGGVQCVY